MYITCLDLEGVLVPEIWIAFSEKTGIPELRRTTRDEPDYDKLMKFRIEILKRHGLGLKEIQDTIAKIADVLMVDEKAFVSDEDYFVIEANEKYGSKGKADAQKLIASAAALFAGGDISEDDKANVMAALQEAYWEAKITNKKYTPKKYRNKSDDGKNDSE